MIMTAPVGCLSSFPLDVPFSRCVPSVDERKKTARIARRALFHLDELELFVYNCDLWPRRPGDGGEGGGSGGSGM